jgi:glyoxylase-like metal-dependent hydrolase (beta-lactamase superfamily II)
MKPLFTAVFAVALLPNLALALDPILETTNITENIHVLSGQGGNIGVLTGPDGTFVIDDQMAPVVPALLASLKKLGGGDPKFLINTHYQFDLAGGNEAGAATGTPIFSQGSARKRLAEGSTISAIDAHPPAAPEAALPVITYSESMHFHLNGDTLRTVHFPHAHTDGDSVIYFENSNVLHTGDIFFNGFYPFIDTENGGSLLGVIGAVRKLIETTDDNTKIIPGHGPLASKADLIAYQDMLTFANASMRDLKKEGKTVEEAIAANPLVDYDAHWGGKLFTTEKWIELLYPSS